MINFKVHLQDYEDIIAADPTTYANLSDLTAKLNVTFYEQVADLTMADQSYELDSGPMQITIPEVVL